MHRGLPKGNTKLVLILVRPWALPTIGPGLPEFLPGPALLALAGLNGYACSTVTSSHVPKSTCMQMHNALMICMQHSLLSAQRIVKLKFTDSEQSCISLFFHDKRATE